MKGIGVSRNEIRTHCPDLKGPPLHYASNEIADVQSLSTLHSD